MMLQNRLKISSFLKKRSQQKYIFIVSVVCVLTLLRITSFLQNRLYTYVLPSSIEHCFDPVYSVALQERFVDASNEQRVLLGNLFTPERFIENLKKIFPYLSALHWEYISCDSVHIKISGPSPRMVVNDQEVILDDGSWSSVDNFNCTILENLPHVTVRDTKNHELAQHLLKISATAPPSLFKQYNMIYLGFYDVLLQPKNSLCNYLLHVTDDFFFTTLHKEYLLWADKNSAEMEKNYGNNGGTRVIYDMRFKDRIYRKIDSTV